MPKPQRKTALKKICLWLFVAGLVVFLTIPLAMGNRLRESAAQRRLTQDWQVDYRVIPLLGLAHARQASGLEADTTLLDEAGRELKAYKGTYPEFFWLELARLEAEAGRLDKARLAAARAKSLDRRIVGMACGSHWDPWRKELGL